MLISKLENRQKIREKIKEKNKYVTYGEFDSEDAYLGYDGILILQDFDGNKICFSYKEKGVWEELSGVPLNIIKIRGMNEKSEYSKDNSTEGGYELSLENGDKFYYSKYGILEKKVDRNNNETLFENYQGKINKIILKTGEEITITRNSKGYIKQISGAVSGESLYFYENDNLVKVIDNEGMVLRYSYDDLGNLIEIKKGDNSSIKINYEYDGILKSSVCKSVVNENGYIEHFNLNHRAGMMTHDYYGEGKETYKFDKNGNVYFYKDIYNNETEIFRNNLNQIETVIKNGYGKYYKFNENGKVTNLNFEGTGNELISYNQFGFITKVIDRDNMSNSYEYDNNGNMTKSLIGNEVCGIYEYYDNGLLKSYKEKNIQVELEYNKYGSIVEEKKIIKDGVNNGIILINNYFYDDKNRLIKHVSPNNMVTEMQYENHKKIIKTENKVTTEVYNNRGWVTDIIEEDLTTGEKYKKTNVYDKSGNIIALYGNDNLIGVYEYYKTGKLKSYTIWNNPCDEFDYLYQWEKTEIKYDENWNKIAIIKTKGNESENSSNFITEKTEYIKKDGKQIIKITEYQKDPVYYTYDKNGLLIKVDYSNGYFENYKYSKAGRLISSIDSNNNRYSYSYDRNGNCTKIFENYNHGNYKFYINNKNQLESICDCFGNIYTFEYDYDGNLVSEKRPNCIVKRDYDNLGRLIKYSMKDNSGKEISEFSIVYNRENLEQLIYSGNELVSYEKYDVLGRTIESSNIKGHYFYEYDYLGNCTAVTDSYGNKYEMVYGPFGELLIEKYPNGTYRKFEYNPVGRVVKSSICDKEVFSVTMEDNCIEENYNGISKITKRSVDGSQHEITNYDTGNFVMTKNNENNLSIKDNYGNVYDYILDDSGAIIQETNPLNVITEFKYNKDGTLFEKSSNFGSKVIYERDIENNKMTIKFHTGKEIEITKNPMGLITEINSGDYSLQYEYDKKGNLIKEYSNKTDTSIFYSYDKYSRCIGKKGPGVDFSYDYDDMGMLKTVKDEISGNSINFKYDNLLRLTNKQFSNGYETKIGYDKYGKISFNLTKDNYGNVISGEFLIYDDFSRIKLIGDKNGSVTKYFYDEQGRLTGTECPYIEEKRNMYLTEVTECGYYVRDEKPKGTRLNITKDEQDLLNDLYRATEVGQFVKVNLNQLSWKEEYSYDKNGNLKTIKNPYGEIKFTYDKLNRIISKGYGTSENDSISLKWNKDNCLEEIKSKNFKTVFEYGEQRRPIKVINYNLSNGNRDIINYCYDGLGRRVLEQRGENNIEYIYEGLSTNLILKQFITANNFQSSVISSDSLCYGDDTNNVYDGLNEYRPESDYRYVDDSKYTKYGTVKGNTEIIEEYETTIPVVECKAYNILSAGNIPLMANYVEGNSGNRINSQFLISDFRNNVVCNIDTQKNVDRGYNYDTWLNYWGTNIEYCVNNCAFVGNNSMGFYDFGYRDYIPMLRCFSSEDPARDGFNWFAYCPCDPINYVDLIGFAKRSFTQSQNFRYQAEVLTFLKFNEADYQKSKNSDVPYMNLPYCYDCSDCTAAIAITAMEAIFGDLDDLSERDKKRIMTNDISGFYEHFKNREYIDAKSEIATSDIIENCRRTVRGYDDDAMDLYPDNKFLQKQKAKCEEFLSDPSNVTIGSTFCFGNSRRCEYEDGVWCNHSMTVLSRKFDEDGNIVGFVVLEGHSGGGATETHYITVEELAQYKGEFRGVYEIEKPSAMSKKCECLK